MTTRPVNFDRLAAIYRALEFTAFGRDLERARFQFVEQLAACRSILILGEGDGRFLSRLLPLAPAAHIHCLDSSAAMLAKAKARILSDADRGRVTFDHVNALDHTFSPNRYDAVVTLFFLDCFDSPVAAELVARIGTALQPRAKWLYADFSLPERGPARWRAQVWLTVLYTFFRWQTGLSTRRLAPGEALIRTAGFRPHAVRTLQAGLVRSVLFERG